jgi:hypothetical protein
VREMSESYIEDDDFQSEKLTLKSCQSGRKKKRKVKVFASLEDKILDSFKMWDEIIS